MNMTGIISSVFQLGSRRMSQVASLKQMRYSLALEVLFKYHSSKGNTFSEAGQFELTGIISSVFQLGLRSMSQVASLKQMRYSLALEVLFKYHSSKGNTFRGC